MEGSQIMEFMKAMALQQQEIVKAMAAERREERKERMEIEEGMNKGVKTNDVRTNSVRMS